MNKNRNVFFVPFVGLLFFVSQIFCFQIDGGPVACWSHPVGLKNIAIQDLFKKAASPCGNGCVIVTDPILLKKAAQDTLRYLEKITDRKANSAYASCIANPPCFRCIEPLDQAKKTLQFLIKIISEDEKTKKFRIKDQAFLSKHFDFMRWQADKKEAAAHNMVLPGNGSIRLTQYGVVTVDACKQKNVLHPYALYALVKPINIQLTKQQILLGSLEKSLYRTACRPLAWVSRKGLEDALMQGTVVVRFADGTRKIFTVAQHNHVGYNKNQKNRYQQQRYWFFKEFVKKNVHEVQELLQKFQQRKGVIFAGDIHHFGVGKLIALLYTDIKSKRKYMRIGILADTGSAFVNNLYQLDIFSGIYESKGVGAGFQLQVPTYAMGYVLCLKKPVFSSKKQLHRKIV